MIDYKNICSAIEFYRPNYKYIETPWYVSKEIIELTKPDNDNKDYKLQDRNKYLVASGEQSFLYLITKGFLPEGRYQTITPCFRDESIGTLHKKVFIKNELIEIIYSNRGISKSILITKLMDMIKDAKLFFENVVLDCIDSVKTEDPRSLYSYDLEYKGIELGSYGIRKNANYYWIYGTGCAEPRLSTAVSMNIEGTINDSAKF